MNFTEIRAIKADRIEALAAAVVAFRTNNNTVVKFTDGKPGNREIVLEHLAGKSTLAITEEDRALALDIASYLAQKVTVASLVGSNIPDFTKKVADLIEKETIKGTDIGMLVWAPKLHADSIKRDDTKETIDRFVFTSTYIGKEKDKVEITFHLLNVRYNQAYNCYRHVGHDGNGNLVGFLNKNSIADGSRIRARVKSCEMSRFYNNAKTTYLNFVKVTA